MEGCSADQHGAQFLGDLKGVNIRSRGIINMGMIVLNRENYIFIT
jgi:hypothetical protein